MRLIAEVSSHLENSRLFSCLLVILTISSGYGQYHDGNNSHGNNMDTDHSHYTVTAQESYTTVYPQIIENKAGIIINDVKSYVRRRKRTLGKENKPLEISISGGNEIFELELWENEHFLAPGFKIYRRETLKRAQSDREIPQEDVYGCHFRGHIKGKSGSPATISICNGLNGLIRTDKDDYLIEPVKNATVHGASGFIGQPHKLYKRSILDSHNQHRYEAQIQGQKDIVMQKQEGRNAHEVSKAEDSQVFMKADAPQDSLRQSFQSVKKQAYDILGQRHSVEKRAAYKFNYLHETTVPKTVEVLVVVDKNMYHKHGDANITTYTLTLFNMLSQLFRDGSLGNKINVVLVGLILLEGDERGLSIDFNADNTLNSFCQWQSVLVGANGRQHDHAILLTGLDLCSYKNSPCDTLGFAPMEGMCNRVRSCTINEDTGLSTAFTIAHEVGHNFGMFHDGEGNFCTESAGKIMSPTLMGKDGQFHWSVCSKAYLMRFLNTPQSDCLDDQPKQVAELKFPDKLPGELYNADIQCKWQFGSRARLCTYDFGKDICKALWCYRGNKRCETKFLPAAEGTSCGKGKWCRLGNCVDYGDEGPKPIDGGWSLWSEWSDCSRSCGGGVISRDRDCSRPLPQYGGHTCDGEDKVFKMCNVQACPEDSEDFHTAQCSTYNKQPFQGWYLQWKPQKKLDDVNEPCKLHCIADTPNYVFTIKHTATDGMNCATEDNYICVQGDCMPVGCDWIVDSNKKRDICGICNGDNSTCRHIQGEYLEQPKLNTYFPVTILPKAARSIRIREKSLSSNYLAVRNIYGKYFLNGHQRVAWPGSYILGGTKFKYNRPYNEPESLEADGPLEEELVLEILVQDHNAGIHYEYTLPKTKSNVESSQPPDNYTWSLSVSSCTEPCAGGTKVVSIICHKNFEEEVAPNHCEGLEKPETGLFPCNEQPCEPRWVTEDWTACSKVCGGGKQKRHIRCRQKVSSTVDKKLKRKSCKHISKPITKQLCNQRECPPDWHTSEWSKCATTCNQSHQTRNVTCRSKNGGKLMPESMCHTEMPSQLKVCNLRPCPQVHMAVQTLQAELCTQEPCGNSWVTGNWSTCSKECGGGVRKRKAWCENSDGTHVKNRMCKHLKKPVRREACNSEECQLEWLLGKWSECSQTCGNGQQKREVKCQTTGSRGNKVVAHESQCKSPKPEITRSCNTGPCNNVEHFDWLLSPWGPCSQTCGQGQSSRYLRCFRLADKQQTVVVSDNHCINISRPSIPMTEPCRLMECVVNHNVVLATSSVWDITGWSECSKTCGNGMQSRIVSCVNNRGQPSEHCAESAQPESTQSCSMGECMPTPLGLVSCKDEYKWCYLVTLHKACSDPLYQQKCCESCNK